MGQTNTRKQQGGVPPEVESLISDLAERADARLVEVDQCVTGPWATPVTWRQPIHTVYIPASSMGFFGEAEDAELIANKWGEEALNTVGLGRDSYITGVTDLAGDLVDNLDGEQVARIAELTVDKLKKEPIEDLRIDFEDGYTQRGIAISERDADEDRHVDAAVDVMARWVENDTGPAFFGIRFKSFDPLFRARGIRTLVAVLSGLHARGVLERLYGPDHPSYDPRRLRLTFPKVQSAEQVSALVELLSQFESTTGLADKGVKIRFEVQVETPQAIIGTDGQIEASRIISAADGRCLSLHYGTYDYSASMGVDAAEQSMEHAVADQAKDLLQVVTAGNGIELSDGSTNRIPVGSEENIRHAWALHYRLVTRHLRRGVRQGWDLHPAQLVTRHLATIGYFRSDWELTAERLAAYVAGDTSTWMDEPATAKAMAGYLSRAFTCGAITSEELARAGVNQEQLARLHKTGRVG